MVSPGMISIVVPAYNAANFLSITLDSVLAQTYAEWELLIVDDGSKDETLIVAQIYAAKDQRVRAFSKANGGCAAARNFGAEQANPQSEYIIFLDHDDLWEPHALETLIRTVQALPGCVGAFAGARVMEATQAQQAAEVAERERQKRSFEKSESQPKPLTFADMTRLNHIWTMGQVLIRRSALQTAGPLDVNSAPVDDWDLYLRLTLQGPLAASGVPVIYWRSHGSNTSNNRELMQRAEAYVRQKLLTLPDLSPAQRELAKAHFDHSLRNLSYSQLQWAKEALAHRQFSQALRQMRRAARNYTLSFTEHAAKK